jgi:monoamine oxidase
VRRAGVRILDDEDYLTPEERRRRSLDKRAQAIRAGLTPDWFTGSGGFWCLPPGLRVAIIGGGFAGIAAAWYLNACGVDTTIFEARSRVGGRVETDHSFVPGKIVEAGAELIGENHPLWCELADRLHLTLDELTDDSTYEAAGLNVRLRFGTHDLTPREKSDLKTDLKPIFAAIGAEAVPVHEREPWRSPFAPVFDRISVEDRLNLLLPAASTNARRWFEFTLPNDNCAELRLQSYLGLLAAVSAHRMGTDPKGMLGYWMSTETHRCRGGNQQLAGAIALTLPDVRTNTVVDRIEIGRFWFIFKQIRVFSTTTTPSGPSRRHDDYDFAILAVPPSVWGGITVDPPFAPAARRIQHGPAVKFLSRYPTKFWEDPAVMLAPSAKWDALGSVWDGTDKQPSTPEFDLTVYSGGPFVLPGTSYPSQLATLYPTGTPAAQRFVDWPTTPFIMTGYGVPGLSEVTRIGPAQILPHGQWLYFAGEQTSMGFFGYMEGALQSGARAARDIVRRMVFPCEILDPFFLLL